MTRVMCNHCERPKKTCICRYFSPTVNHINVIVLQHPTEVKQSKGSLPMLKHSLSHCTVYVGEDFTDNQALIAQVNAQINEIAVLYPSENAQVLRESQSANTESNRLLKTLIILDGTWKKAYKIFQLNPFLHQLSHVKLADDINSLYSVRKTKKSGALSTLEACCHALSCLEGDNKKYQTLLNNFIEFNEMHLAFR